MHRRRLRARRALAPLGVERRAAARRERSLRRAAAVLERSARPDRDLDLDRRAAGRRHLSAPGRWRAGGLRANRVLRGRGHAVRGDSRAAAERAPAVVARRRDAAVGVDRVAAERDKNTLTNCCADEHAQFLPLRDYFARRDDLVFDGLAGDVLSQSQRLDPALHASFADGRFDDVAERVLGDAASMEPALQGLLTSAAMARLPRTTAAARVRAQAAMHAGAPNPIASFYFFSRMRREIALAPYALLDVAAVSTPFLDAAIVDLLLSVPFEIVRDRRLHTDALHRRYPRFASIPFAGREPGRDVPARVRRDAAALAARLAAHRGSLVRRGAALARTARAFATGRRAHLWFLPRLAHLMDVEERAAGIIPPAPPRSAAATPTPAS